MDVPNTDTTEHHRSLDVVTAPRHAARTVVAGPSPRGSDHGGKRADIQALRALAVSMVVLYHLWPNRLTGGYTGVDVFFVISGFLITSHLLGRPPRHAGQLAEFWSRRVRRLLPAALLVLFATLIATRLVAPDTSWSSTAGQVKAAALYMVNWRLASNSVSYLGGDDGVGPVQHFWSLSVEEQFYLLWPILILVLIAFTRRRRDPLPFVGCGLAAIVLGSLWFSVHETTSNPDAAYFMTPTRIWELGAGGLLAALTLRTARGNGAADPVPAPARCVLAWAGLLAIAWTAVRYDANTAFPGWRAIVPVLGAVAVITARSPAVAGSPLPLMRLRPVQWLGDVSYSLYLWHWPLIVLVPYVSGEHLGILDKLVIIACSLALAGLTKRLVEDRFRRPARRHPLRKAYVLAAAGMAIVVAAAALLTLDVHHRRSVEAAAASRTLDSGAPCLGAAAMAAAPGDCPRTNSGDTVPTALVTEHQESTAFVTQQDGKDCTADQPDFPFATCRFGDPAGTTRVALVGNSHAADLLPALERIAEQRHWQVTTYLALGCALADIPQKFPTQQAGDACTAWVHQAVQGVLAGNFDLVIMSNRAWAPAIGAPSLAASAPLYARGYAAVLRQFHRAGLTVVGVRDTPYPGGGHDVPQCLEKHPDDFAACSGRRSAWLSADPMTPVIEQLHDRKITEVDLTRYLCTATTCPSVIGQVPVYFDDSHLSQAFAQTLAPYLTPPLVAALGR